MRSKSICIGVSRGGGGETLIISGREDTVSIYLERDMYHSVYCIKFTDKNIYPRYTGQKGVETYFLKYIVYKNSEDSSELYRSLQSEQFALVPSERIRR
jgi:hypothetical protein